MGNLAVPIGLRQEGDINIKKKKKKSRAVSGDATVPVAHEQGRDWGAPGGCEGVSTVANSESTREIAGSQITW